MKNRIFKFFLPLLSSIVFFYFLIGIDIIARLPNNKFIWNFKGKYKTLNTIKDLRNLFGLGKKENRIYEALIAKITLYMFTYNIVSYINRIKHESQTLGEL